jgi:Family of unknown function (DUF5675)
MKYLLLRHAVAGNATLGYLYVGKSGEVPNPLVDTPISVTLEDSIRLRRDATGVVKGVKIKGQTAIPDGEYEVIINWSNRFGRLMPLLLNVPQFEGIRIHAGNTPEHTEGCILTGQQYVKLRHRLIAKILGSRAAYFIVFRKLRADLKKGKVFLKIVNQV